MGSGTTFSDPLQPVPNTFRAAEDRGVGIYLGDALEMYGHWPSPVVIVSDGAYGVAGFPGDTPTIEGLTEWYAMYSFVRQPQTFPDVRLQNSADPSDILLGIELKGWYLLAKEKEPSFRFLATPQACARADLFVVYPWHLSEVISGVPRLTEPYVELARHVAEYRNYHWEHVMSHRKSPRVIPASARDPYPSKTDEILDKAEADGGRNFGRIARTGLMDSFCVAAGERLLSGIPARYWRKVFNSRHSPKRPRQRPSMGFWTVSRRMLVVPGRRTATTTT